MPLRIEEHSRDSIVAFMRRRSRINMELTLLGAVLAGAIVFVIARAPLEADDPVSSSVSFNREIIRIIQRKCEPCHAPGGLSMSLSDYRDARAWGRAIREELVEHRMPPAIVARGYRRY